MQPRARAEHAHVCRARTGPWDRHFVATPYLAWSTLLRQQVPDSIEHYLLPPGRTRGRAPKQHAIARTAIASGLCVAGCGLGLPGLCASMPLLQCYALPKPAKGIRFLFFVRTPACTRRLPLPRATSHEVLLSLLCATGGTCGGFWCSRTCGLGCCRLAAMVSTQHGATLCAPCHLAALFSWAPPHAARHVLRGVFWPAAMCCAPLVSAWEGISSTRVLAWLVG